MSGLLGQFDHTIDFPLDWDFVIIYGPNGVGKTKLLELVVATCALDYWQLNKMPFERARLTFDDATKLTLSRDAAGDELPLEDFDDTSRMSSRLTIILERQGVEPTTWRPAFPSERQYKRLLHYLAQDESFVKTSPNLWREISTGQVFHDIEMIDRMGPPHLRHRIRAEEGESYEELREYLAGINCHLIDTQRLLAVDISNERSNRGRQEPPRQQTVTEFGSDLSRRLRTALARNSRATQQLDRSFPRRIMSESTDEPVTEGWIRDKYMEQNTLRARLASIAVLEAEADVPLPNRPLKDWEKRVLSTYLTDTDEKLATFSELLDRVQLFREIVNARFLYKSMEIDLEQGFRFVTSASHEVAADRLSSGEQHEIVLIYDLLFNVEPGSLVLIDEPEISLHIGWQQEFLNDLSRISDVVPLRFIIATHSPQIIHKWWEKTVALTPETNAELS